MHPTHRDALGTILGTTLWTALGAALSGGRPGAAAAQEAPRDASRDAPWPSRPIRLIAPFPPGGTVDLMARLAAERLQPRLGQSIVIENRAGAGGNLGTEVAVKAEPDGYTLVLATIGGSAINYALYGARMPYRPEDLAAVGLISTVPNVLLATKDLPARDVAGLVALAKARPGALNLGNTGVGASTHVTAEMFKLAAGIDMASVPFRGAGPMLTELMAGRVEAGVDNLPSSVEHIRDGRVRCLGVTSATRSSALPDVPTLREQGLAGFEATAWFGLQAPARTPRPVVEQVGQALDAALREPAMRARLAALGAEPAALPPNGGTSPAGFEAFLESERGKWAEVVRRARVTVE
ncbi:tripartite tricarboxylate transporter substrate binding protein [Roseomonas sp. NAR14]|uniref:Tripartite tricarboxylate transporter substrate binding protein n=1 Tax=Roseomonas acroporae TaxID=2937791 RepID=A0A9X1Y7V3_9PROT|nr:tripartite tricarboxylate transporter substrate binding protein [Roseomonas acroporae]MCK8784808.1 tripartite tricarboxylate transporter substrate binding protein [Roseomonas acroporae]